MTINLAEPPHIHDAAQNLEDAGWVRVTDCFADYSPLELAEAREMGKVHLVELGSWRTDDIPRAVHMVRRSELAGLRGAPTLSLVRMGDPWALEEFAAWMRSWDASTATIKMRLSLARRVARQWPDPAAVSATELQRFLGDPAMKSWTRRTYWVSLRALFGWLTETGRVPVDVTVALRAPTVPKGKPRPLSDDQVLVLLENADLQMLAWLRLGLYAGLRVHEAAKIRGDHVTSSGLFVVGKGQKPATLPVHPLVAETAAQMPERGFWFPGRTDGHTSAHTVTTSVSAYFRDLGIGEGSFHRLRHTYATNLLRAGVNVRVVQTLMRHESLATTQGYLAVDEDERAAAIRLL